MKNLSRLLPEYRIWQSMCARCNSTREVRYKGRGIKVCSRWKSFENFYKDMGPRPVSIGLGGRSMYQLNRINNDGDYEPGNCEWATCKNNSRNRSSVTLYEIDGITKCIVEWAEYFNVPYCTMKARIKRMKNGTYGKPNGGRFKTGPDERRTNWRSEKQCKA